MWGDAERPDKFGTAKSVRPLHLAKCDSHFDGLKVGSVASRHDFKFKTFEGFESSRPLVRIYGFDFSFDP